MLKVILRDGRTLAYREYGKRSGFPVIFTHGNLNSRLFAPAWTKTEAQSEAAGARVVAVDRPGYGGSTVHHERTYSTWAMDCAELADHLNFEKYAVLGYSSGGPHALAAAALNSDKVTVCHLLSSDAPYFAMGMVEEIYKTEQVTMEWAMDKASQTAKDMKAAYEGMKDKARREIALADIAAATEQGYEGAASDAVLEAGETWGFDLCRITACPVHIWHGTDDKDVPLAAAEYLSKEIGEGVGSRHSNVTATFIDGENHTLLRRHWEAALTAVVEAAQPVQKRDNAQD